MCRFVECIVPHVRPTVKHFFRLSHKWDWGIVQATNRTGKTNRESTEKNTEKNTEKDTEKESKQGEHREGQGEDAGKDAGKDKEKTNRGTQTN